MVPESFWFQRAQNVSGKKTKICEVISWSAKPIHITGVYYMWNQNPKIRHERTGISISCNGKGEKWQDAEECIVTRDILPSKVHSTGCCSHKDAAEKAINIQ